MAAPWPRWSRSLALAPRLGTEFLPELNEGTIWVNVNLPPGISVDRGQRSDCAQHARDPAAVPEVRSVISKAGRPEDGTDPKPINMAEIFVDLKPPSEWKRDITKEQTHRGDGPCPRRLPGIEPSFSQPIRDNVLESISQIDGQVVIKVSATIPRRLREKAAELLQS